jgi:uncharacterized protein YgiB involved in biofilm formation
MVREMSLTGFKRPVYFNQGFIPVTGSFFRFHYAGRAKPAGVKNFFAGRSMKRSKEITLVLIASASFVSCSSPPSDTHRELYANREKCVEDWGSEDRCEQQSGGRYWGPRYYYYGGRPFYFPRNTDNPVPLGGEGKFSHLSPGMKSLNSSATFSSPHISRGGFGRIGSFFHGGS